MENISPFILIVSAHMKLCKEIINKYNIIFIYPPDTQREYWIIEDRANHKAMFWCHAICLECLLSSQNYNWSACANALAEPGLQR